MPQKTPKAVNRLLVLFLVMVMSISSHLSMSILIILICSKCFNRTNHNGFTCREESRQCAGYDQGKGGLNSNIQPHGGIQESRRPQSGRLLPGIESFLPEEFQRPQGLSDWDWSLRQGEAAEAKNDLERSAALYNVGRTKLNAAKRISEELGRKVVFDGTMTVDKTGAIDPETGTIRLNARVGGPENLFDNALRLLEEQEAEFPLDSADAGGYNAEEERLILEAAGVGGVDEFDIEKIRPKLKTVPNTAFFWSGRTDSVGGAEVAANIAEEKGGVTLESTISSKKIVMPEWDFSKPSSMEAWNLASGAYAEQVSGEIRAVVGSNLRPGNIWENIELPKLKANPKVTKIIIIDPKTREEKIIFER